MTSTASLSPWHLELSVAPRIVQDLNYMQYCHMVHPYSSPHKRICDKRQITRILRIQPTTAPQATVMNHYDMYPQVQPGEEEEINRAVRIAKEKSIRRRKQMTVAAEFCSIVALGSLVMVLLGSTHVNNVLDDIWFMRVKSNSPFPKHNPLYKDVFLDGIGNINAAQMPHFYQVGLWNYCEGFDGIGITYCSTPTPAHYFNPVESMFKKAVPAKYEPKGMAKALKNAQRPSKCMYVCFVLGGVFSLMSLVMDWLSVMVSRNYILTSVFALCAACFTLISAITSSQLFIKFWLWLGSTPDLKVYAELGVKMYSCTWMSFIFSSIAFVLHVKVSAHESAGKPGWKFEQCHGEEHLSAVSRDF